MAMAKILRVYFGLDSEKEKMINEIFNVKLLGIETIIVAVIGSCLALYRFFQFKKFKDEVSRRLARVFISDFLIYLITGVFGLYTFFGINGDLYLYPMRILFFIFNIVCAFRLTQPLLKDQEKNNVSEEVESIKESINKLFDFQENVLLKDFKLLRTVLDSNVFGAFLSDFEGRCLYVNGKWEAMTGIKKDDALGDGWVDGIHPDDAFRVKTTWNNSCKSGGVFCSVHRYRNIESFVATKVLVLSETDKKNISPVGYVGIAIPMEYFEYAVR